MLVAVAEVTSIRMDPPEISTSVLNKEAPVKIEPYSVDEATVLLYVFVLRLLPE